MGSKNNLVIRVHELRPQGETSLLLARVRSPTILKMTTHEWEYMGKSIIVVEDELVEYILQPPTDEPNSDLKGVESGEVKAN